MAIQFDYKTGIKRQIVNSLKTVFDDDFSIPELRGRVNVSLDYPMEEIKYPAIYITYQEDVIRNEDLAILSTWRIHRASSRWNRNIGSSVDGSTSTSSR